VDHFHLIKTFFFVHPGRQWLLKREKMGEKEAFVDVDVDVGVGVGDAVGKERL
jgi:hypothetical protein